MEPLDRIDHRPYPLPKGKWLMRQSWHNLLFAHWPVPAEAIRPYVPAPLEIDTYDGSAWLGVVAFRIGGMVLRGTPISLVPSFPEINLRTYVTYRGKPGVYFISLDAPINRFVRKIANVWFRLPYKRAEIIVESKGAEHIWRNIRTDRKGNKAEFHAKYAPVSDRFFAEPGTLTHFLTERYCMYTVHRNRQFYCTDIHHIPWTLQEAEAEIYLNSMADCCNVTLKHDKPIVHFAEKMDALFWGIAKLRLKEP